MKGLCANGTRVTLAHCATVQWGIGRFAIFENFESLTPNLFLTGTHLSLTCISRWHASLPGMHLS